jgi:AraC-like DNA-binding protein
MNVRHAGYGYELVFKEGGADNSSVYENHCHPFYEIIMVTSGDVLVSIENSSFAVSSRAMVIIEPGAYHSVTVSKESEYKRITFIFEGFVIPKGVKALFVELARSTPVCYHEDASVLMRRLAFALCACDGRIDDYSAMIEAITVEIFYLLASSDVRSTEGENDRCLQLMLDYIMQHITEKITLDDIAGAAFVSRSAVCRFFKDKMHTTFKQYLLQKKITYAAHLIREGMPAERAAKLIGYENYAGFYKMYKKFLKKAPTERNP